MIKVSERYMQTYNSRSKRWVKLDKETGSIVAVKSDRHPYKNTLVYKGIDDDNIYRI